MPVSTRNGKKATFDPSLFTKLIALCDSNVSHEADAAFHRALEMCTHCQMPFTRAITEAFGGDARTAQLETELKSMRNVMSDTLGEAEDALRELRDENVRLRQEAARPKTGQAKSAAMEPCRSCERKRRVMAAAAGVLIGSGWYYFVPWNGGEVWQWAGGVGLSVMPITGVICRWRWLMFKRKYAWVSRKDNDLWRVLKGKWNRYLERLRLR